MCAQKKNLWPLLHRRLPICPQLVFLIISGPFNWKWYAIQGQRTPDPDLHLKEIKGYSFHLWLFVENIQKHKTKSFPFESERLWSSDLETNRWQKRLFGSKFVGCSRCFILLVCRLRATVGEILPTHIDPLCEDNPGPLSPLWISEPSPYKQPPCSELHYYLTKPFASEERTFRLWTLPLLYHTRQTVLTYWEDYE